MTYPYLSFNEAIEFLVKKSINPKTGRKIEEGKTVYNKIMKDIRDNYPFLLVEKKNNVIDDLNKDEYVENIPPVFISKEFCIEMIC